MIARQLTSIEMIQFNHQIACYVERIIMIIDGDVHISPFDQDGSITIEELLRRMDRSSVTKALTWLQPPYFREITEGNRYIYRATQNYPDRILGFGWTDPHLGESAAIDEARRCVEEYGFYGVKLNGAQNSFFIDDEELSLPIIDAIARLDTTLAFHIGTDAYEATHPFRLAKIARRYPDVPILMVHMGGVAFHDLSDAAIEVAQECPNITLIGSGVRAVNILKAVQRLRAERVCFGSDTPFALMHVEIAMYNALLEGEVTPDEKALIMGDNITRLFGL
jgi:predicted TIM-barrel fold metal-dependent hydrolase